MKNPVSGRAAFKPAVAARTLKRER